MESESQNQKMLLNKTLSEETVLYRNIVEDSAVGVFVSDITNRKILYINNAGRSFVDLPENVDATNLDIAAHLRTTGKSLLLTNEQLHSLKTDEYLEFHTERHGLYFDIKARALTWNGRKSYIVYISDESEMQNRQIRLQNLVNNVPCGIGIYEINRGKVSLTYLNDAYYKMLGIQRGARKQFFGEHSVEVVHPEDMEAVTAMIHSLCRGENEGTVRHRIINGDGIWVWLNLVASVIERKGDWLRVYVAFSDCDQLVRSQQELERKQMQENTLLASIPGGVAIYRLKKDGRFLTEYVSTGLARMCGYQHDEFEKYLKDNGMIIACSEDIPAILDAAKKSLAEHTPISINYRIHTKSEGDILNRLDANPMDNNELEEDDLAVWYAVHTRVSLGAQLALHEQVHYRSVLEMLGIAYWEWSKENGFYFSENYKKYALSQNPMEEVREKRVLSNVVHPDDIELLKQYLENNNRDQKTSVITLRMLMLDGSYQWTELISFADYTQSGELIRRSGTLRNVNDEWIKQRAILEEALAEAKKANTAKTAFLSRVSHDMRTPLNGILGLAGLMRENVTDKKILSDLLQMEVSGQYLLNLINDTLDVGRIESGNLELHPSACDGHAIFDSVTALATPGVAAKHIHAEVKTSGLNYPMLYIDIGRVQQIMLNVLGNAIKFTPEGGHIICSMKNLSMHDDVIVDEVCIQDDGIGISADFLPHIFEPFSQEDSSKKNTRQGTGLGMMITKQLIEKMGGEISISSEQGKGTTVTFTLVMPIATREQIAEWRETQKISANDASLSGKHILLCEDHPLNAQIATRLLEKKGILVEHAPDGRTGVDKFRESPQGYYAAVLMDVRMPIMDGLEATAEIRKLKRPDAARIPIIAMTANALDEDVRQTKEAGMNEHLSKPIQPEILYQVLGDYISQSEREGKAIEE